MFMTPREIIDEISLLQGDLGAKLGFQIQTTILELNQPPQRDQVLLILQKYLAIIAMIQHDSGANRDKTNRVLV